MSDTDQIVLLLDTWARLLKAAGEDPANASNDVLRRLAARTGLSFEQLQGVRHARNACAHGESSEIEPGDLQRQIALARRALDRVTSSTAGPHAERTVDARPFAPVAAPQPSQPRRTPQPAALHPSPPSRPQNDRARQAQQRPRLGEAEWRRQQSRQRWLISYGACFAIITVIVALSPEAREDVPALAVVLALFVAPVQLTLIVRLVWGLVFPLRTAQPPSQRRPPR
ncbi:MAG: hypothetical protein AAGA99_10430 [Actinomycetota bacterium]